MDGHELDPFCQVTKSNLDKIKDGNALRLFMMVWVQFADENNECTATLKSISECTGYSKFQIRKSFDYLVEVGVVRIEHRYKSDGGRLTNKYILTPLY